jgi:hypothetical protein
MFILQLSISAYNSKPLGIKPEITNYAVAASKLSYPRCSIIDAVCTSSKEKRQKDRIQS